MKELSLNANIKVELNEEGKKIFFDIVAHSTEEAKTMFMSKIDEDGYLTISIFSLMNIFGSYISRGVEPFSSFSLLVNERDILDYQEERKR